RGGGELRPRPDPDERFVELVHEVSSRVVQERFDESSAHRILGTRTRPVAVEQRSKRRQELSAVACAFTQQNGCTHRGSPGPLVTTEQRLESLAQLVRPHGPLMEERQLPALD